MLRTAVIMATFGMAFGAGPGQAQDADLRGTWEGTLDLPTGASVRVVFHIDRGEDGWQATWDSPDQGAVGLPAGSPTEIDGVLTIPLPVIQGRYEGRLGPNGNGAEGTFHQGAAQLDLVLRRSSANPTTLDRPQEPKGPFPYRSVDVTYPNPRAAGVRLAGTLTVPEGVGPFPAAILISGSGPQDRNESLAGHKPFLVLADHLTRNGIAVLRFDDRGVGESTGTFGSATSLDFAMDVQAGIQFLLGRPEVDGTKIGLIGHSEGGLIAPLVANESGEVAFVVLLAGPGLPGDEILRLQGALIARAEGSNEAGIDLNDRTQQQIFALLKATDDPASVREEVRAVLESAIERVAEIDRGAAQTQKEQIPAQVAQVTTPWFHFFVRHDPRVPLRRMTQPVLAINGTMDLQVPARENLDAIDEALQEAGNPDVTTHAMEGLNHLFQSAVTGAPSEYANISETMSPRVLQLVAGWILDRTR